MHARIPLFALVVALALGACSDTQPAPAAADAAPPTPAGLTAGKHAFTAADGSSMPYEVTGAGDATVVLIHCWMCDRTYWSEQVPVLAERYRTITLDLPGHGEASAGRLPGRSLALAKTSPRSYASST